MALDLIGLKSAAPQESEQCLPHTSLMPLYKARIAGASFGGATCSNTLPVASAAG